MPRFYLNVRSGDDLIEDPDGSVLPDLTAAREEALVSIRHLLAESLKAGKVLNGQRIEIVDEDGELRATIPFKDAIKLE